MSLVSSDGNSVCPPDIFLELTAILRTGWSNMQNIHGSFILYILKVLLHFKGSSTFWSLKFW